MRKQFKNKLRSCKLCKPHKMGWANRWKVKDAAELRETEREVKFARSHGIRCEGAN